VSYVAIIKFFLITYF